MNRIIGGLLALSVTASQTPDYLNSQIDDLANRLERKVIEWRRDFHQNPELSNREFRTAEKVANHLRSLGMEVQTEIGRAHV